MARPITRWFRTNTIAVELNSKSGRAKPPTEAQVQAWLILVRFLQERYGIPSERVYAHNWIDFKDARYCESCELATLAQKQAYVAAGLRGSEITRATRHCVVSVVIARRPKADEAISATLRNRKYRRLLRFVRNDAEFRWQ